MGASVWDKEGIVDELKKLVGERLSSSRIAAALAFKYNVNITRNAVISKVWRIGMSGSLSNPRSPSQRKKPVVRRAPPPRPAPVNPLRRALEMAPEPMPETEPELVIPIGERKTLLELEKFDCKWPIGHVGEPDFHFCARKQVVGTPYCDFHLRRAYSVPVVRSRPNPSRPYIPSSKVKEDA